MGESLSPHRRRGVGQLVEQRPQLGRVGCRVQIAEYDRWCRRAANAGEHVNHLLPAHARVQPYKWYPWYNAGHYAVWRAGDARDRWEMIAFYRRGVEAVAGRATNGFRVGIPFIWCSNDLMVSFATQAHLYRLMCGDGQFREADAAFNTGFIVYHDDLGDYSTNEPIMDGTANLVYLLAALAQP